MFDVAVGGMQAQVDPGGQRTRLHQGPNRLVYGQLVASDAEGRDLPAWMEATPSGLRVLVDDGGAAYPLLVDPLLQAEAWTTEGDQNSAMYGYSVDSAGDVNGDGYSDVVVGIFGYDHGQTDEGGAFLYLGSASGLETTASWTGEGDQGGARYGRSVAPAGDVNGDGFGDVVVGSDQYDAGESDEGAAFLYLGSASGLATTASWLGEGNQAGASYGIKVAGAGDVDGDGYSDVVVGAFQYDVAVGDEGAAFLYLGSSSGLSSAPAWTHHGDDPGGLVGYDAAPAGDVNGDGYSDIVLGAFDYHDAAGDNVGAVFLFFGSASGLPATASWVAQGDQAGSWFGLSTGSAGDVNGDGYSDVLVGARGQDLGQDGGAAYLYLGSPSGPADPPAPSWIGQGDQAGAQYGQRVRSAGDVNGDGYADILVSANNFYDVAPNEGAAYLYLGTASGPEGAPSWTGLGGVAEANYGFDLASAGDVNGDGFSDVVIGAYVYSNPTWAEGAAFVCHGSPAGPGDAAWTTDLDQDDAQVGCAVASAGDVNGDGFDDVLVGAYLYDGGFTDEGAAFLFAGSASGPEAVAFWTTQSNQESSQFGWSVASAGDVDGDGFADLVVGAPYWDEASADEGAAFVYLGSASGPSTVATWTAASEQAAALLGYSVASAGDVNGDGFSDLVVGIPQYDSGETDEGAAWLFAGSPSGLATAADWAGEGGQVGALFGSSVASAGDVDGDRYSDLVVGASQHDDGETDEGAAFVFAGSPAGLAAVPIWTGHGDQAGAQYGASVASVGDVDGDGFGDLLIGAPFYDDPEQDEGAAFLYIGSSAGPAVVASWTGQGDQALAWYGYSVGAAGDVNGDGYGDVVVGAPLYDAGQTDEGAALVYLGSASGPDTVGSWLVESDQAGARLGHSVASAGDVDADGFDDLIVGAATWDGGEGAAFEFPGNGGDATGTTPVLLPRQLQPASTTPIFQDCNGADTISCFEDQDEDGVGSAVTVLEAVDLDCDDDPGQSSLSTDCADDDPARFPGNPEICDSQDNDCDITTDEVVDGDGDGVTICQDDCDDGAPDLFPGNEEICDGEDNDCVEDTDESADSDGDGRSICGGDCDETNAAVYEGAPEVCDGLDDDCDGVVPSDEADADGDGQSACEGDCDDSDSAIYLGAPELCDGQDNGCVGSTVDEDDADGDGHAPCAGDCDDTDDTIYPTAPELCDGLDQDCDQVVPSDELDGDADGVAPCAGDCDDADPARHPGHAEICDDRDNDCDAATDELVDGDGDGVTLCQEDCDDDDPDLFPGNEEVCDGGDNDCDEDTDELADRDGDGQSICGGDCDEDDDTVYAGAPESCNGVDDDCDGELPADEVDGDGDGQSACEGDCDDTDDANYEGNAEVCDGQDNDCDDSVSDEEQDTDGDGYSPCDDDCDDTDDTAYPDADELCDGTDQDCDGAVPDDELDGDGDGLLPCEGDCNDDGSGPLELPPESDLEACTDGADNDCDGLVDVEDDDCDEPLYYGPGCTATCSAPAAPSGPSPESAALALLALGGLFRRRRRPSPLRHPRREAGRPERTARRAGRRGLVVWGLAPVLLVVSAPPASAETEDDPAEVAPLPLVLAADPAAAAAAVEPRLVRGAAPEIREWPRSHVVGGAWTFGVLPSAFCPTPSLSVQRLEETLLRVQGLLDSVETEEASASLGAIRQTIACLDAPPDATVLWRLHFLEGVSGYYNDGDAEAALPALSRALAIRPGEGYDDAYPPGLRDAYVARQAEILTVGEARVLVAGPADRPLQAWVDGVGVPVEGMGLTPGEHLLQVRGTDGVVRGGVVALAAGDVSAFAAPESAAGLLRRLSGPEQVRIADGLRGEDVRPIWLVDGGGDLLALGAALPPRRGAIPLGPVTRRSPLALISVGGGYQNSGEWDYAAGAVDLSIRIVGPLRVGAMVRPSVGAATSSWADGKSRRPVLVPFGVGAVFRLEGPVSPRLAVHFQGAVETREGGAMSFLPGISGTAGLDIPLGASPLAIRPMVEAGLVQRAFTVRGLLQLVIGIS